MNYNQEFIELLRNKDKKALTRFLDDNSASLIFYASQRVRDKQEAEDIVMTSIENLLDKIHTGTIVINDGRHLNNTLYKFVRDACIDAYKNQLRKNKHEESFMSFSDAFTTQPDWDEPKAKVVEEIYLEIERLPKATREVFKLYLLKYSREEIARKVNRSEDTVKNQLQNAKNHLRRKFKNRELALFFILAFIHTSQN
jgi:RNA polymerase sigma factor, sigma-70 family